LGRLTRTVDEGEDARLWSVRRSGPLVNVALPELITGLDVVDDAAERAAVRVDVREETMSVLE